MYELAARSNPYVQLEDGVLLYLVTPVVVLSSFLVFPAPSAFMGSAAGRAVFADIAENAATDTLAVFCLQSACYSLWSGRKAWFWMLGIMTHLVWK